MDLRLELWLFGGVFGLIGVLFVLWWQHIQKCIDRSVEAARVSDKVAAVQLEIGNHERGIIGQLHRYSKIITRLCAKVGLGDESR